MPSVRQEIFSLPEGTLCIQWPDPISEESLKEITRFLEVLAKKMERSVIRSPKEAAAPAVAGKKKR